MHASRTIQRARPVGMVLAAVVMAVVVSTAPSDAANTNVTVTMSVPSATSITPGACVTGAAGKTAFGVVQPDSKVVSTVDCSITFGSSNDTAALRVAQSDGGGAAMWRPTIGNPDPTFGGGDGMIGHAIGFYGTRAIAARADGTFIVAGDWSSNNPIKLTKHLANGDLDSGWGTSGVVTDAGCGTSNWVQGLIEEPNGKLVVLVGTSSTACVLRLLADGSRDPAFNSGNSLVLGISGVDPTIARLANGSFIIGGDLPGNYFAATRVTSSGAVDTTFGSAGIASVDMVEASTRGVGAVVRDNGSIVLFGAVGADAWFGTALLTASGVPDASWGPLADGRSRIELEMADVTSAALAPDGSVIVAGSNYNAGSWNNLAVARFDQGGLPDPSFSSDGFATQTVNFNEYIEHIYAQPDGSILGVGGTYNGPEGANLQLVRFTSAGLLDPSFGGDGRISIILPGSQFPYETPVAHVADGSIIVGGGSDTTVDAGAWSLFKFRGLPISNFALGSTDWDTADTNLFGACLRSVSAGALTDVTTWTRDTVDADCADADADPWRAIPATLGDAASKVATSPSGNTAAMAHLRFGIRTRLSEVPGSYVAPIRFEVVAPSTA